ncbi:MAG: hypothetical protein WCA89_07980 [Terracidiphilus sp.]
MALEPGVLSATETSRLVFVKYLVRHAKELSESPEPMNWTALLLLQDAAELFLQIAAERLDAQTNERTTFPEYWERINGKLPDKSPLPMKEAMGRMNKARVALKHHGNLPHADQMGEFLLFAQEFFNEATPIVFGVALDSVSMLSLIQYDSVRNHLEKAEQEATEGKIKAGVQSCGHAFAALLAEYHAESRPKKGLSPFDNLHHWTVSSLGRSAIDRIEEEIRGDIKKLDFEMAVVLDMLEVLCLGVDYRRYAKFTMIAPRHIMQDNGPGTWLWPLRSVPPTPDDLRFCIDFVLDTALHLQEFRLFAKSPVGNGPEAGQT